ncbi:MAG: CapA family protein [Deltaproteobacteria bacterium]|nr:CapA family protein [Deltaproteobacteria bacterium]
MIFFSLFPFQIVFGGETTLLFGGDVMLGRLMNKATGRKPASMVWGDVRGILQGADLTLVNQEFAITSSKKEGGKKAYYFRADPGVISLLKSAGIDYVSLANNHILDYGPVGLSDSIDYLERAGIAHAGAGENRSAAREPARLKAGNLSIAVISITDNEPEWNAGEKSPGIFYLPIRADSVPVIRAIATEARKEGAHFIILSAHWGGNWVERPSSAFKSFAHAVMDAGVDLVHGHSGHVIQGIEIYRGKPIFYNMGDVIDDYAVDPVKRNDLACLAHVILVGDKVVRVEAIPTAIDHFRVGRATGENFDFVYERLKKLSGEMGTEVKRNHDRLQIEF